MAGANSSYTYEAEGNKEDVSDIIVNISPDENLLINKFGRVDVTAVKHEWLTDDLRPAKTNKQLEKASFTSQDTYARRRMSNNVQHFMAGYFVTDAQEKAAKYGVKSEISYQMVKASKETARDLEFTVLLSNAVTDAATATEPTMGGVKYFNETASLHSATVSTGHATNAGILTVSANHSFHVGEQVTVYVASSGATIMTGTGITDCFTAFIGNTSSNTFTAAGTTFCLYATPQDAMNVTGALTWTVSGSTTAAISVTTGHIVKADGSITETHVNDMMQKLWTRGGNPDIALMSGKRKREISAWTAGVQKTKDMENKKLSSIVDIYESDFGVIELVPHRQALNSRIEFLELQYWKLGYYIPFHVEDTPRSGTFTEKSIVGSVTLENKCPVANGSIIGIS